MKIFDLNVPLEDSPSEPLPVKVAHQAHKESAPLMASFFEAELDDLPNGLGWANDASVELNFIKGYFGIWLQMVLVIAFGVMFSTFLSGPVAMIATLGALGSPNRDISTPWILSFAYSLANS